MLTIKKSFFASLIILVGILFLLRLMAAMEQNVGHLIFLRYLETGEIEQADTIIKYAEKFFLHMQDADLPNRRVSGYSAFHEWYYGILAQLDEPEIQTVGKRLQVLAPGEEIDHTLFDSIERLTPPLPILSENAAHGCWELQQLRYDRAALELGPLVPVQLIWQHTTFPFQTYNQSLAIINLAPNAGFEWGEAYDRPIGYSAIRYSDKDDAVKNYQLLQSEILSETTTVTALVNSPQQRNTGYRSYEVPIGTNNLYFQGGWIKSNGGRANFGQRWRGNVEGLDTDYHYVIRDARDSDWTYYGQIVTIPTQVERVSFLLINRNADGSVFFDDILFFAITIPDCEIHKTP
jgi:hypothetical protein